MVRRKAGSLMSTAEKAVARVDILMSLLQQLATECGQREYKEGTLKASPVLAAAAAAVVAA